MTPIIGSRNISETHIHAIDEIRKLPLAAGARVFGKFVSMSSSHDLEKG